MQKKRTKDIDLTAPIQPGWEAAGVMIGDSVEVLPQPQKRSSLTGVERFDYRSVSVFIQQGFVCQVCVYQEYEGKLADTIGIGSTIAQVQEAIGTVTEDDCDNLIVASFPGWCFETEEWRHGHRLENNQESRTVCICVYGES
jgi:hypothetical protein